MHLFVGAFNLSFSVYVHVEESLSFIGDPLILSLQLTTAQLERNARGLVTIMILVRNPAWTALSNLCIFRCVIVLVA